MEGMMPIGVLIDFDLASYPEEMVNKILGLLRNDDKAEEVRADADTAIDVTNNPVGTTKLNPYPTGVCQDRSGTTPFMAIETLDLNIRLKLNFIKELISKIALGLINILDRVVAFRQALPFSSYLKSY